LWLPRFPDDTDTTADIWRESIELELPTKEIVFQSISELHFRIDIFNYRFWYRGFSSPYSPNALDEIAAVEDCIGYLMHAGYSELVVDILAVCRYGSIKRLDTTVRINMEQCDAHIKLQDSEIARSHRIGATSFAFSDQANSVGRSAAFTMLPILWHYSLHGIWSR
jgi:hypothetical protein